MRVSETGAEPYVWSDEAGRPEPTGSPDQAPGSSADCPSIAAEAPPAAGLSRAMNETMSALRFNAPMMAHMRTDERPRERLLEHGAKALSTAELLALLLRSGPPGRSVMSIARELLESCNHSLVDLSRRSVKDLTRIDGIGPAKACEILAAVEFANRMRQEKVRREPVDTPEHVYRLMAPAMQSLPREELYVILVNTRLMVTGIHQISKGTVNETIAHPRDIFQPVILHDAYGFLLVHNHPSGDPSPSQADRSLTRRVSGAADTLQVRFLDHIIIGHPGDQHEPWFSFREAGLL